MIETKAAYAERTADPKKNFSDLRWKTMATNTLTPCLCLSHFSFF